MSDLFADLIDTRRGETPFRGPKGRRRTIERKKKREEKKLKKKSQKQKPAYTRTEYHGAATPRPAHLPALRSDKPAKSILKKAPAGAADKKTKSKKRVGIVDDMDEVRAEKKKRKRESSHTGNFFDMVAKTENPELQEMQYLSEKLGLHKKSKDAVRDEFAGDGLGDILDLLDTYDFPSVAPSSSSSSSTTTNAYSPYEKIEEEESEDEEEEDEEEEEEEEDEEEEEEEEEESEEEQEQEEREDIYGRVVSNKPQVAAVTKGGYVPPHLRTATSNSSPLLRQVKGLVNRLSENNVNPIMVELAGLYASNSRSEVNALLFDCMFDAITFSKQMLQSICVPCAALMSGLHATVGSTVGAFIVEKFVLGLLARITDEAQTKESANILLFLSYLYNLDIVHCKLVYGIVRRLCELTEPMMPSTVELLLVLLRHCGWKLRQDDPHSLKNIVSLIQQSAGDLMRNGDETGRSVYMMEMITDLKHNKRTTSDGVDASLAPHRAWLRTLLISKKRNTKAKQITQLCFSLEDVEQAETKGRWWLVGSTWAGISNEEKERRKQAVIAKQQLKQKEKERSKGRGGGGGVDGESADDLLALAARNKMSTDFRKAVFCVIMAAEDYVDAFEKIVKMNIKGTQDRQVARVLMHCCGKEKSFNPFYSLVAARLCQVEKKYRFTFQLAFWDVFKQLQTESKYPARKAVNLAKMLAYLFNCRQLSLVILKAAEFRHFRPVSKMFFTALFSEVFSGDGQQDKAKHTRDMIHTLANIPKEDEIVLTGIDSFLKKVFPVLVADKEIENLATLAREELAEIAL